MWFIVPIALLTFLKYFEVGPAANMSWWWVIGLMVIAFIWFEFVERILGLDKKKAHDESERIRAERVKKAFEQNNRKK